MLKYGEQQLLPACLPAFLPSAQEGSEFSRPKTEIFPSLPRLNDTEAVYGKLNQLSGITFLAL